MALIVEKFGGTSLANREKIINAARIAASDYKNGDMVVVVVSASGGMTDDLLDKAGEITGEPGGRALDMLLATGEQQSAALMTMALKSHGVDAVPLCGWQAGVNTDSTHGNAQIRFIDTSRVMGELRDGHIVVVAGFQGIDQWGDITTIGRGGSDTTAVALAAALGADICRIYTDVSGVYTADPSSVKGAIKHKQIYYDDMLELSRAGAGVLHDRSVEMAKNGGVTIEVKNSTNMEEGTIINGDTTNRIPIVGVALSPTSVVVTIRDGGDQEKRTELFGRLAAHDINVETISWGEELNFTVLKSAKAKVEAEVRGIFDDYQFSDGMRKLSLVGAGADKTKSLEMLKALSQAGVNIRGISTGGLNLSAVIDENMAEAGQGAVHRRFIEEE